METCSLLHTFKKEKKKNSPPPLTHHSRRQRTPLSTCSYRVARIFHIGSCDDGAVFGQQSGTDAEVGVWTLLFCISFFLHVEEVPVTRTAPTICLPLGSNSLVLELFQQALVKITVVATFLCLNWFRVHLPLFPFSRIWIDTVSH